MGFYVVDAAPGGFAHWCESRPLPTPSRHPRSFVSTMSATGQ